MVEIHGKRAELALLAVPIADAFVFSHAQFQRILSKVLGLEGAISTPRTHHYGGGAVRGLTQAAARELDWMGVNAQRAREKKKRNHNVVWRLQNEAGSNTVFTPIVTSACGAMVPLMFLKEVYGRAKDAEKFLMSQQPALKYSRNTMVASSF